MIQKFKIKNQLLDVSGLFQCEVCGVDTGVLSVQPQQKIGGTTEKFRDFYEEFHGEKDIIVFPVADGLLGNIQFLSQLNLTDISGQSKFSDLFA